MKLGYIENPLARYMGTTSLLCYLPVAFGNKIFAAVHRNMLPVIIRNATVVEIEQLSIKNLTKS
jgi:hypothetical protein